MERQSNGGNMVSKEMHSLEKSVDCSKTIKLKPKLILITRSINLAGFKNCTHTFLLYQSF